MPLPPSSPPFCSVWGTGQDQMRIVKQRLLEMMPALAVFLDVDDLEDIDDLEDAGVLPNNLRELLE